MDKRCNKLEIIALSGKMIVSVNDLSFSCQRALNILLLMNYGEFGRHLECGFSHPTCLLHPRAQSHSFEYRMAKLSQGEKVWFWARNFGRARYNS